MALGQLMVLVVVVVVWTTCVEQSAADSCRGRCWLRAGQCAGPSCLVSCSHLAASSGKCLCAGRAGTKTGDDKEDSLPQVPERMQIGARSTMYAGAWIAPWSVRGGAVLRSPRLFAAAAAAEDSSSPPQVVSRVTWRGAKRLEAASWMAFSTSGGIFRTGDPRGLWVHHLSAYEHSVVARHPLEAAMGRVRVVSASEVRAVCRPSPPAAWPHRPATVGIVPFYGGRLDSKLTGNAHSIQPLEIKLLGLLANVCSLIAAFCARLVVATCSSTDDAAAVESFLANHTAPLQLARRVKVLAVDCLDKPSQLPFEALRALVDDDKVLPIVRPSFVVYNEADQVYRWGNQRAATDAASFISDFAEVVLTPHRWHKRYGSDPGCGATCGMSLTGQNLCHSHTPNVNVHLVARNASAFAAPTGARSRLTVKTEQRNPRNSPSPHPPLLDGKPRHQTSRRRRLAAPVLATSRIAS